MEQMSDVDSPRAATAEPVRFSSRFMVRCQPEVVEQIDEAARQHGQKPAEFVRQAVLKAPRSDGIDPVAAGRAS